MIKSKLPDSGTSIFSIMSGLSARFNAINLSQGFPDFNCSDHLIGLVNDFMKKGYNQYAPMPGVPGLRREISAKIKRDYGRSYDSEDEITITAGATQALYTAFSAIISKGDEVIIFEPAYDSYRPAVEINGGIPVSVPLNTADFSIPWDKVYRSISDRTRCIVINSPHNPSGAVLNISDIEELRRAVSGKDIFIISDEVYEHIIFDGKEHLSLARFEDLAVRTFVISSFGKTFHTTGWKTGYCCAPKQMTDEFRKIHQFVVFAVNTPVQLAYEQFLKNSDNIYSLSLFYSKKRDLFRKLMSNSRFRLRDCSGTYFQLLDYSGLSDEDDLSFSKFLTMEAGVAVIPLSPFYSNGTSERLVRVCFAKKDSVLEVAAGKLLSL